MEKRLLKELLAGMPQAHTALEVGCGTGHFTRWFAARGLRAVGLDLSSVMLTEAVRVTETALLSETDSRDGLSWIQADGRAVPFRHSSFDVVTLITTLEFIPAPAQALREALRVARRGLLLGVLNRHSLLGWQLQRSEDPPWPAARLFTPAELRALVLQAAGDMRVSIVWRTTLWPAWSGTSSLPWGGFIGMRVTKPDAR